MTQHAVHGTDFGDTCDLVRRAKGTVVIDSVR